MNPFVSFMASTTGRIVRIVAGFGLIALGLLGMGGAFAVAIMIQYYKSVT